MTPKAAAAITLIAGIITGLGIIFIFAAVIFTWFVERKRRKDVESFGQMNNGHWHFKPRKESE